jgi:hypothetical protein
MSNRAYNSYKNAQKEQAQRKSPNRWEHTSSDQTRPCRHDYELSESAKKSGKVLYRHSVSPLRLHPPKS